MDHIIIQTILNRHNMRRILRWCVCYLVDVATVLRARQHVTLACVEREETTPRGQGRSAAIGREVTDLLTPLYQTPQTQLKQTMSSDKVKTRSLKSSQIRSPKPIRFKRLNKCLPAYTSVSTFLYTIIIITAFSVLPRFSKGQGNNYLKKGHFLHYFYFCDGHFFHSFHSSLFICLIIGHKLNNAKLLLFFATLPAKNGRGLIFKYEKGQGAKKKGRGEHPAKSAEADHWL